MASISYVYYVNIDGVTTTRKKVKKKLTTFWKWLQVLRNSLHLKIVVNYNKRRHNTLALIFKGYIDVTICPPEWQSSIENANRKWNNIWKWSRAFLLHLLSWYIFSIRSNGVCRFTIVFLVPSTLFHHADNCRLTLTIHRTLMFQQVSIEGMPIVMLVK